MGGTPAIQSDQFATGAVIAGKYVVERVIGVGAVGIVLAARHTELEELVAIKFLHPQMQERSDIVGRFASEAKAAVRIKSEFAARIYDVGVDAERGPYLVMEYLDGKNLGEVLDDGPIPAKRAVELMLEVCEALAVAHSHGITHRDIKPENLFLSRRGDGTEVLKVLDFGISKRVLTGGGETDAHSKTEQLLGTPAYMAPEQIRSSEMADHRSDIWSLGVVFYEMLTREFPFPGDTLADICAQVLEKEAPPLANFVTVPDGLQAVLDRCFQKDPDKRFQNVAELAIALLPYGPTRARVFAERASTILEASGKTSGVTFRFSSLPPTSSGETNAITIPDAPLTPRFSSGTAPILVSRPSEEPPELPSLPAHAASASSYDGLPRETPRPPSSTVIVASLAVVIGLAGAIGSFVFGASRGDPPKAAVANEPAAVPSSAPPPAVSAPQTSTVTIAVVARPTDATLFIDDAPVGSSPFRSVVPRDGNPHAVRAEAPGYTTRSLAITYDSDKEIVLALDKTAVAPRASGGGLAAMPRPTSSASAAPSAATPVAKSLDDELPDTR